nr:hypothetical protein [Tanacetum cinerariifolium]
MEFLKHKGLDLILMNQFNLFSLLYLLPVVMVEALKDNPTLSFKSLTKSFSTSPKSFLEETNTFHNSLLEFENFCFDLEEINSGSTTTHYDISLPDYEAFYFDDDHIEEISSGSTTIHSDVSLSEYDSALHPGGRSANTQVLLSMMEFILSLIASFQKATSWDFIASSNVLGSSSTLKQ